MPPVAGPATGGAVGAQSSVDWEWVRETVFSPEVGLTLSMAILVIGAVLGYVVWRYARQLMVDAGVPEAVEGTPFERTARRLGTSTVGLVSSLAAVFVYIGAVVVALNVSQLATTALFWQQFTEFLPNLFIAVFALIFGLIGGDKAKLVVGERLRSVKLPEVGLIPELVKYSIFYLAALVALGQLRVQVEALLILLAAYVFGLVFLSGIAFWDLLRAGAAGLFLVLTQPYGIGDEVVIDDRRGIVQEIGMLVTHVESDGEEYIIPNQRVFDGGVVRVRE